MRMVCGLIRPTSGSMKLFGESSEKGLQEKRKNMGALIALVGQILCQGIPSISQAGIHRLRIIHHRSRTVL